MEKRIQNMNAENRTAKYLKYLCKHGKYKYQCKECGGTQICPHNRQKSRCKECGGSQICPHSRRKDHCKKCSDPIKVNIEQWIFSRRQYDKMRNIYDADRFIDKCFLKGLIEDYKQCYYGDCEVNLQYTEYRNDLASIERLDNSIGHIKSNCVLCCLKCNKSNKSEKKAALMRQLNLFELNDSLELCSESKIHRNNESFNFFWRQLSVFRNYLKLLSNKRSFRSARQIIHNRLIGRYFAVG